MRRFNETGLGTPASPQLLYPIAVTL